MSNSDYKKLLAVSGCLTSERDHIDWTMTIFLQVLYLQTYHSPQLYKYQDQFGFLELENYVPYIFCLFFCNSSPETVSLEVRVSSLIGFLSDVNTSDVDKVAVPLATKIER